MFNITPRNFYSKFYSIMRIALIGYGKMGKAIEEIALKQGYDIVLKISSENKQELSIENLKRADVAIEFSNPESAKQNILTCIEAGVPVISGSTGWLQHKKEVENYCLKNGGAFLYSSNFSVGVNILFELNKFLAEIMSAHPEYNVSIQEVHHTQKKDAPSGTAITLAEQVLEKVPCKEKWVLEAGTDKDLVITSKRKDPAAGTHNIKYFSSVDDIEITHTAHNRKGFASGALLAATFIMGKTGVFNMKNVLDNL